MVFVLIFQLKEQLAQYGVDKFEDLTLVEDMKNEGLNRGFAFLDFPCRADALEACKRLQRRDVVLVEIERHGSHLQTPSLNLMMQLCLMYVLVSFLNPSFV